MKKLLIALAIFMIAFSSKGQVTQRIVAKAVLALDSVMVKDRWVKKVAIDTTDASPDSTTIPSMKVIRQVLNKPSGGSGSFYDSVVMASVQRLKDTASVLRAYSESLAASKVNTSRTITINGTTLDLSANRSWSVGTVSQSQLNDTAAALRSAVTGSNLTVRNTGATGNGLAVSINDSTLGIKKLKASGIATLMADDSSITIDVSGGGGSPAGIGTELQYRNAGAFGAMSGTSWDETNRKLTLAKTTGDSALLVFDGDYAGAKVFSKIRPPQKNDSTPEWHWISQINANDDGSRSNHVIKFKPFRKGAVNNYYGIGDEWEGHWRTGGAQYFERHIEAYLPAFNESARLLSFTFIGRDSMRNSQNQIDFRGTNMIFSDLKNNTYFSIGKSGNVLGVNAVADLIGTNPYYKLTDETTPATNYTTFQQSGPDINISSYRNISFSSRQLFKTVFFTGMLMQGDAALLSTSSNWGATGLLQVNPSHASTGIARFQHSGTDALWITSGRKIIVNSGVDNSTAKLQFTSTDIYWTGTPAAIAGDTKIIVKGASDSLLKQSSLKTVNGNSMFGIGDITTATSTESTYTVTLTNTTNIASSSTNTTYYQRVGDVVHVWGEFTATATATGICEMGFSIPVSSGFTNSFDGAGTGSSDAYSVRIFSDAPNDRMTFRWTAPNTSATTHSFHFTYKYIAP